MGCRAAVVRLRIDARRPASWLALATGAAAAWWIAAPLPWWPVAAVVAGAVVSAAAVGVPPREPPGGGAAWAIQRVAWPAAGAVAAWLARAADPAMVGVPVVMIAAGVAAAAGVAWAGRGGASPADATGQALAGGVAAAASAGVVLATAPRWAMPLWPLAAVAGWAATAAVVRTARWPARAGESEPRGPLAGAVPRAVMATALAGMVTCLFLAPHLAPAYAALAAAWLLVAAVPRAVFAVRGPSPPWPWCPGTPRDAARVVAAYAVVLAWPPVVAVILAGSSASAAEPVAIAIAIGIGAAVVAAAAAGTLALGWSRDTALAVVLGVALAVCMVGGRVAVGRGPRAIPPRGLMLSIPGDPARLSPPREEPRVRPSPRGVASCPASPSPASARPPASWRWSSFWPQDPAPGPRVLRPARRSFPTRPAPG